MILMKDESFGSVHWLYMPKTRTPMSATARWLRTAENRDVSAEPLAHPFACLLTPLTHSLAPYCSLLSLARSLPSSWESVTFMSENQAVLNHSVPHSQILRHSRMAHLRALAPFHITRVFYHGKVQLISVLMASKEQEI